MTPAIHGAPVLIPLVLLVVLVRVRPPDTVTADVLLYSPAGAHIPEETLRYDEVLFTKAEVAETTASTLRVTPIAPVVVAPGSVSLERDQNFDTFHVVGRAEDPEVAARIATTAAAVFVNALQGQKALQGQFAVQRAVIPPAPAKADGTTPVVLAVLIAAVLGTSGVMLLRPSPEQPGFITRRP